MVKFGKNKFKALNKISKKQKQTSGGSVNKILKKKLNADKKVTFQKEVLLKETSADVSLVKNVTAKEILVDSLSRKPVISVKKATPKDQKQTKKVKAVAKQKKRQKTQIDDTKLLLRLMSNKTKV